MTSHVHPPGTAHPADRAAFLIDGCPRCEEYVAGLGVSFDAERFRSFWAKMVEVERENRGRWESRLDRRLGHQLYLVSLALERAFGVDPRILAVYGELTFVGRAVISLPGEDGPE